MPVSSLRKFPAEIRCKIYGFQLLHQEIDSPPPALLIALAGDRMLYEEALSFFREENFHITHLNARLFKDTRMTKVLLIKYISIIASGSELARENFASTSLMGNKILLRNNLKVITFDLSTTATSNVNQANAAGWLINASTTPEKLVVKLRSDVQLGRASNVVVGINAILHVKGKLQRVAPADCEETWFWESGDGKLLSWSWGAPL